MEKQTIIFISQQYTTKRIWVFSDYEVYINEHGTRDAHIPPPFFFFGVGTLDTCKYWIKLGNKRIHFKPEL